MPIDYGKRRGESRWRVDERMRCGRRALVARPCLDLVSGAMNGRLRCAVYLPNFGAFGDARVLSELAQEAEAAGWDGFFLWDHIARPFSTPMVDPWIALAAVAVATARLRIGALVTPLPRRRPWKVAREAVSLDHLCGGRLVLGVGTGSPGGGDVEWSNLGEEMEAKARGAMLDEGLSILTGLWSGAAFSHDGRHYHVREARFEPPPLQRPRIPIWVAGGWPNLRPFRRAARWDGAFPWFAPGSDGVDQLRAVAEFVRAERAGDEVIDIVYATAPSAAGGGGLEAFADAGASWWLARIEPEFFGSRWRDPWPLERMRGYIRDGPNLSP